MKIIQRASRTHSLSSIRAYGGQDVQYDDPKKRREEKIGQVTM
jgi:hypothetical protein